MISTQTIFIKTNRFLPDSTPLNPGVHGEQFATWIAGILTAIYKGVEKPAQEDFGWVVKINRKPYPLLVCCGNRYGSTEEWGTFVTIERSLFQRLFGAKPQTEELDQVFAHLRIEMEKLSDAGAVSVE